jgi:hypothetical protein
MKEVKERERWRKKVGNIKFVKERDCEIKKER